MSREKVLGSLLGVRQEFKASLSRITHDKLLLTNVECLGETFDHLWVDRARIERKYGISIHKRISFTGVPYEYIGLDEDAKQVTKCGVKSISKLNYLYKLRKGQR